MTMKFMLNGSFIIGLRKSVSFGRHTSIKYFLSPFLILFPCLVIIQDLALADVKPKFIDSGAKCRVVFFDDLEHYSSGDIVNGVKINKDGQNIGDKLRLGMSGDSVIANVVDPSSSDKGYDYSDNGRNETDKRQRGFWYGWQWVLLYILIFSIALWCALWLGWYMAKWSINYIYIPDITSIIKRFVKCLMEYKHGNHKM